MAQLTNFLFSNHIQRQIKSKQPHCPSGEKKKHLMDNSPTNSCRQRRAASTEATVCTADAGSTFTRRGREECSRARFQDFIAVKEMQQIIGEQSDLQAMNLKATRPQKKSIVWLNPGLVCLCKSTGYKLDKRQKSTPIMIRWQIFMAYTSKKDFKLNVYGMTFHVRAHLSWKFN